MVHLSCFPGSATALGEPEMSETLTEVRETVTKASPEQLEEMAEPSGCFPFRIPKFKFTSKVD